MLRFYTRIIDSLVEFHRTPDSPNNLGIAYFVLLSLLFLHLNSPLKRMTVFNYNANMQRIVWQENGQRFLMIGLILNTVGITSFYGLF